MRLARLLATAATLLTLAAPLADAASQNASPKAVPPADPPGQGTLLVGAASRSVLPLVDGGYDYLKAGFPPRKDANDPGIPVPAWDDGRIAVGNGEDAAHWVRDDIRAAAMAIDDPRSPRIVVIVISTWCSATTPSPSASAPRRCCRRASRRSSRSSSRPRTTTTVPTPLST
jgi:hypothetical protein